MTVNNKQAYSQQISAAAQTKFTINFQFEKDSDLQVYKTAAGETPNPTTDLLNLNTDYTVIGAGWGVITERSVNLTTGASLNDVITIIRNMDIARETDFSVSGDFSAADLNDQFDDVVGMIQQVDTKIETRGLLYINNQILDQSGSNQTTLPKLADQSGSNIPIWTTNSSGTLIASTLEESSSLSTLRADLADDTNGADGSRLVGYYNASLSPANTTVKAALDSVVGSGPVTFGVIGQVIYGYFASLSGWLEMDDGTIGPAASGADHNSDDYENLYTVLWDNVIDAWCPVTGGRGASASADWSANKPLRLPQVRERAVGVYNQSSETVTMTAPTPPTYALTLPTTANLQSGMRVQFTTTGTLPTGIALSTDYWITVLTGTTILISDSEVKYTGGNSGSPTSTYYTQATSTGSGTHTLNVQFDTSKSLGEYEGYHEHILTQSELTEHTHSLSTSGDSSPASGSRPSIASGPGAYTSSTTGTSVPFTIMQPTTYQRAFIKYQ